LNIFVTADIQNGLLWLECRHREEMAAPLVHAIVSNALFHSNSHIDQMLHQIIHILRFCRVDSLQQILQSTGLRSGLFRSHKSGSPWIIALSDWRQKMVH